VLSDDLLELQRLDTTADQLANRRRRLPEREPAAAAEEALAAARRRREEITRRDGELAAAIAELEHDGAQLTTQRSRLQAQLKTVISPREAEALMHELETLQARRDEMDDRELAHLEEQSALDDERSSIDGREPALVAAAETAGSELHAAEAAIDAGLATIRGERAALASRLDAGTLDRYERLRQRMGGVAVAKLDGRRCRGSNLDLSASELDQVKATAAGELTECPDCGRLLVP
jgi:predicted  nucleic acid-binding Zn-ribbon protein